MAKKKQEKSNAFADAFLAIGRDPVKDDDAFDFEELLAKEEKESILQGYEQAKARGVEMIDISLLDPNPMSLYHMREDESFEALKNLIKANGFEAGFSIVGKRKPDGRVAILSGHRRTAAARSIVDEDGNPLITQLPIIYKEFDREVDELEFITSANLKRADNISDVLNMYQQFSDHFDRGDWKDEEVAGRGKIEFIAAEMGLPQAKIRNNLFLLKYPSALWQYIDEGVLSISDVRKLYSDNEKGRLKNHDEIVKALVKSRQLKKAGKGDEALAEAKKEAKEILAQAERKYERKKKPENAGKVVSRLAKDLAVPQGIDASGMDKKEKSAALKELGKVKKEIERLESILKEG